jgi:hypothetical protein
MKFDIHSSLGQSALNRVRATLPRRALAVSSNARPHYGRRRCLPGSSASRLWPRHGPARWPARLVLLPVSGCHVLSRVCCPIPAYAGRQHGADIQTGQSASFCRSALTGRRRGAGPQSSSRLESVLEFCLGKKALAPFKVSLALRNSLTSRSSPQVRSRSSLGMPSRNPVSTSCLRTHLCRVCGTLLSLGASDPTAAHHDAYSPWNSRPVRTARSPTSGEIGVICS